MVPNAVLRDGQLSPTARLLYAVLDGRRAANRPQAGIRVGVGVLAADLKTEGVTVVNCTPGSALTCFPMGDLEQELVK